MAAEKEQANTSSAKVGLEPTPITPEPKAPTGDLIDEIGTLTYPRAVAAFGKDKAIEAMKKVAEIGGHGLFEEDHFKSPLFGGLAMPSPDSVIKPRKEDFDHLPESDFYFQQALDEYEITKEQASMARSQINEYYAGLKS